MRYFQSQSRSIAQLGVAAAVIAALALACSGGPTGPAQGSPEWYLQAAGENYALRDYGKTVEQLKEAMKGEGEVRAKALLWRAVVTGGLARGYNELTNSFADGVEANDMRTDEFQNPINDYRRRTRINAIEFSESAGDLQKLIDSSETIAFDFPLPDGNGSQSPQLASVRDGNAVPPGQMAAMENQTLERGIFTVTSILTGGTEFSALQSEAGAGGIQAAKHEMGFGVARLLLDVSVMFDRDGINDPKVRLFVLDMAERWGEPHYEHEEFADAVEEFKFDMVNERRDIEGKRRIKKED